MFSISCANEPFARGYPAERGQVELQGETPKQLGAARCCETCRIAVNTIFLGEDTFFALHTATKYEFPLLRPSVSLVDGTQQNNPLI